MLKIDENILKSIVSEEIRRFLIREYALERSDFMDNVRGISRQIIIHWCLINFANLTQSYSDTIPHWKHELKNWLFSVCEMEMKKNNSYRKRHKAILEVWDKYDFINNPSIIKKIIFSKFINEKIDVKSAEIEQTISNFIEDEMNIIELMATGDVEQVNTYVENL